MRGKSGSAVRIGWLQRGPIAAAVLLLVLGAAPATAQLFNQGLVFSELHHSSAIIPGQPGPLPSYIELLNRDVNVTTSPPLNVGGALVRCQRNGVSDAVVTIPQNVLVPPGGVLLIAAAALPGVPPVTPGLPLVRQQLVAASFFAAGAPGSDPLHPNLPQRLCLTGVVLPVVSPPDRVDLMGSVSAPPCSGTFRSSPQLPFVPNFFGHVNRVLYLDSDTAYDFDGGTATVPPATAPTPGYVDDPAQIPPSQGMSHVNGFLFGPGPHGAPTTLANPVPFPSPTTTAFPFSISGLGAPTFTGTLALSGVACTGIDIPHHPRFPVITDPVFDPVLSAGTLTLQATIQGFDPLFGQIQNSPVPVMPGMFWNLVVPPTTPTGQPGVLNINMGPMTQQQLITTLASTAGTTAAGRPRIVRFLSDLLTDATASASGSASPVQIDVIPGSTGGGDIWCEIIIYDENGFSYRAKVRNCPSNPTSCTTPNLGLGSNAVGNVDIIALCFTHQPTNRELYVLPSLSVAPGPFFGITPDALTLGFLLAPLGVHPAHVTTTADGLYFYSVTNGGLSGLSLAAVAVEFEPSTGFTQFSPVATITVQ